VWQAFLLGVMVAYTPALIVVALAIHSTPTDELTADSESGGLPQLSDPMRRK
jgi:hypothetical protein